MTRRVLDENSARRRRAGGAVRAFIHSRRSPHDHGGVINVSVNCAHVKQD